MRYFNKHRRGLMKQGYKVGTRAEVSTDTAGVVLENPTLMSKLKIQGNTHQNRYTGKNLCDLDYFMANYYTPVTYSCVEIFVGAGNIVTVSIAEKLPTGLGFYFCVADEYFQGSGFTPIWMYHSDSASHCNKSRTFTATKDYIFLNVLSVSNFAANVGYLQVEIGNQSTEYEPYVGGTSSPNPNYPQPIEAVSDMELTAKGVNIFNATTQKIYTNNGITLKSENNLFIASGIPTANDGLGNYYSVEGIKPNITYSFRLKLMEKNNSSGKCEGRFYMYTEKPNLTYISIACAIWNLKGNEAVGTYTFTEEQVAKGIRCGVFFVFDTTSVFDNVTVRADIVEGDYTKDTMPPFEEYFEPVTVSSIGIDLAKIEDFSDEACVDYASKRVFKTERVLYARVSDLIDEYGAEFDGNAAICINCALPRKDAPKNQIPYFCTHFKSYQSDLTINEENPCFEITASGQIWFYYPPKASVDEFKSWCLENDVRIAYALLDEREADITNTEAGRNLLDFALPSGKTVMLEVKSEITPKSIDVEYYSKTKEDKCSLTVHYNDTECNAIYESNEYFVRRDSVCVVTSPKVEGYEPQNESTFVYSSNDTEITLIYNKK